MNINIYEHRPSPDARTWDLPPWGHILSKGVLPLFMRVDRRLIPIGTAYWLGGGVPFVMTALHCITEALREQPKYERMFANGLLPSSIDLKNCSFYVLHQDECTDDGGRITLIPLETVDAGPPTDVAICYSRFGQGRITWSLPISFDPPRIGSKVWSLGYTQFEPIEGIPIDDVEGGIFDWVNCYKHRFVVTEGTVEAIFTESFIKSYNGGPCFAFDNALQHGQSGGPVISADGRVVGLNSATATHFFDKPMSLGSMFYPLLLRTIRTGVTLGSAAANVTFNMRRLLIDLVFQGAIKSDGSEANVAIYDTPEGQCIGPRVPREDQPNTHSDFAAMQSEAPKSLLSKWRRFVRPSDSESN